MAEKNEVTIRWLGHSCFLISLDDTVKMITDPFDKSVGYPMPDVSADICVVSHDHFDHNCVSAVKGNPQVVKGSGEKKAKDVNFKGVGAFHDEKQGSLRGENTIFLWELGGIKFAHMGDLGTKLSQDQIDQMGSVDVLFVPTGGYYTIDAQAADKVVSALNPRVVMPMHYKTPVMGSNFPIAGVNEFLQGKEDVVKVGKNFVTFTKETLPPKTTIYVLEYK
jgi:L-ascorbate metabolism protein UlaG (beta-lactamase superfamily)